MRIHAKNGHSLVNVYSWGERKEVPLRINFGEFNSGDEFPVDQLHYHETRTTYFCVVSGSLIVEVEGEKVIVTREAMLEVIPLEKYRTLGVGDEGCQYVVIGSHNLEDKVTLESSIGD